ncbi:sugar-binding transcriptional regulator [Marivivens donghaensis]|uniref:Sugar-binding transcriptional regulator n=2 Tax=Marivivens donghaensis TaxID=1699413 RepID=A0ABX0W0B3_9RHOB|nr:sugar-binding transcriptional regulator [Marivivens donghaensis]
MPRQNQSAKTDTERGARLPADDELRMHLMVTAARMAFIEDRSQTEIASHTGLNRWQVRKLLADAKEQGVVRIEINPPSRRRPDLEAALREVCRLRDAVVVSNEGVAKAAGQYLASCNLSGVVGVSWGRTMSQVARWLPQGWAKGVQVVQINGTVAPKPQDWHLNVAETFARKGDGQFVPLPVPAIVGSAVTRDVLEQDRIVADVLSLSRIAQTVCFSFGAVETSALLASGHILPGEHDRLCSEGAVGDVLGRFINTNGQIVDGGLDARTIGLTFDDLRSRDRAIGVSSGAEKQNVVLGALRAGIVNVLVTDEETATYVMEHFHDR